MNQQHHDQQLIYNQHDSIKFDQMERDVVNDEEEQEEGRKKMVIHQHLQIQMRRIIKEQWEIDRKYSNNEEQIINIKQEGSIIQQRCQIYPQNQDGMTTISQNLQKECPQQRQTLSNQQQHPQADNDLQQQRYLPFDDIFKKQIRQYIIDNLQKQQQQFNKINQGYQEQEDEDVEHQSEVEQISHNIGDMQYQSQQNDRYKELICQQQKQQMEKKDQQINVYSSKCQVIEIQQEDSAQLRDKKNENTINNSNPITQIQKYTQQTVPTTQNNPSQTQKTFINTPMQKQHIKNIIYSLHPQLSAQITEHNSRISNKTTEPSTQQLKNLDNQLKSKYPSLNISKIIQIFHNILHEYCQMQRQEQSNHNSSTSQIQNFVVISDARSNHLDYTKSNTILRNKLSNHLIIDSRLLQQKKIAISFLKFGYGLRVLRQQINDDSITNTRYNNTITVIIRTSFRKMQEYMAAYHKNIVIINSQEERIMRAPLINCQKWMPPEELETYYKFIKLVFSIEIVQITEGETVKLHQTCMKQLRLRLQHDDRDFKRKKKESKIQTGKMDRFKNIVIKNGANLSINPVANNLNQAKKIILNPPPQPLSKPFTTFKPQKYRVAYPQQTSIVNPQKTSIVNPQKPLIVNNQVVITANQNITSNQPKPPNIEKDQKKFLTGTVRPKSVQFILGNVSQTNSIPQKLQKAPIPLNTSLSTLPKTIQPAKPQFFPKPILKKPS